MADPLKKRAQIRGRRAEWIAALWLRLKGYRIIAHDWRVPSGEIDIICTRGGVLAFVEVKARADTRDAAEAISDQQRQRIRRAAEHFLARHPDHADKTLRFDAVLICAGRPPKHLEGAWWG